MAPVAAMFEAMRDLFETTPQGWTPVTQTVSSVSYSGNRSYTLTMSADVSATLSPGMRVKTTRTVTAPTQCTSLNGTTQYYSKTTPTGLSFTTTFTCSAWIKLNAYGSTSHIIGRRNGATEGFNLEINSSGQLSMIALRILANNRYGTTYQSVPLNKWVHVAASMDVSVAGDAAHKMYIDGVEVPSFNTTNGTITALVQGTTALAVGAQNTPTAYFNGKIAQAAVFSAVLSAATIRSYYSQGLAGTETSLVSAYSFNGVITDLNTTNANNLTAQASAVATNADSPFAKDSFGTATGTTDFGIVQSVVTTTVVVQVPEGNTIPTSGGVSAMSYSTQKAPYGMPVNTDRWLVETLNRATLSGSYGAINTWTSHIFRITCPIGQATLEYAATFQVNSTVSGVRDSFITLSAGAPASGDAIQPLSAALYGATGTQAKGNVGRSLQISLTSATDYTLYSFILSATGTETFQTQNLYIRWIPSTL